MSLFQNELEDRNFFQQTFVYMLNTSLIEPEEVIKIIESIPEPIKEDAMTTYSLLTKKYKQEGRQEGEQIGIQKKEIEVVLTLNEDKIPIDRIAKYTKLSESDVRKILQEHGKIQ